MKTHHFRIIAAIALLLPATLLTKAQPYEPSPEVLTARDTFQDDKFGIFIHWGIYSMLGSGEWVMNNRDINYKEYTKLASGFYPSRFDADAWVSKVYHLHLASSRRILDVGHQAKPRQYRGCHTLRP